jgi:hypothetical protein
MLNHVIPHREIREKLPLGWIIRKGVIYLNRGAYRNPAQRNEQDETPSVLCQRSNAHSLKFEGKIEWSWRFTALFTGRFQVPMILSDQTIWLVTCCILRTTTQAKAEAWRLFEKRSWRLFLRTFLSCPPQTQHPALQLTQSVSTPCRPKQSRP